MLFCVCSLKLPPLSRARMVACACCVFVLRVCARVRMDGNSALDRMTFHSAGAGQHIRGIFFTIPFFDWVPPPLRSPRLILRVEKGRHFFPAFFQLYFFFKPLLWVLSLQNGQKERTPNFFSLWNLRDAATHVADIRVRHSSVMPRKVNDALLPRAFYRKRAQRWMIIKRSACRK